MRYLAVLSILSVAYGHICMWAPPQRGGFQISTPGEDACYLKEGPCGGISSGEPTTTLLGGRDFSILFQQNLNHFYINNPGSLRADIAFTADPQESDFTELGFIGDYNAMNEITQTNFTLKVTIPNVDSDHAVVRMRYVSQNPTENDRGMTFYQCSDVKITKQEVIPQPKKAVIVENKKDQSSLECCTAKQFTMEGYETASWRNPTSKKFYFDTANKLFRVDTVSGNGITTKDGNFQMISNFTSGIEYYYNVVAGTCSLYGLNYWSDWCYGSINQQDYQQTVTIGTEYADVWVPNGNNPNSVFTWSNIRDTCIPISSSRIDTGEMTIYYNFKEVTTFPEGTFTIPTACQRAEAEMMKKGEKLSAAPEHHFKLFQ